MKRPNKILLLLIILASWIVIPATVSFAAQTPQKILILPFKINASENMDYVREGILDMLSSRLAWADKVVVMEKALAKKAAELVQGEINEQTARRLASSTGADWVIFGSLTKFGQSVSLDAKLISRLEDRAPITVHTQAKSLDKIIEKINQFTIDINKSVFNRQASRPRYESDDSSGSFRKHPDTLLKAATPEENERYYREKGFWRSRNLRMAVIGLDVGDVDGDSKNEIVYATKNKLFVGRYEGGRLIQLASYKGLTNDNFISIDVADINGNGRAEIFVNNQSNDRTKSYVFELISGKLKPIVKNSPWSFRIINPPYGRILIGQEEPIGQEPYGKIFKMVAKGKGYAPSSRLKLPTDKVNILNFGIARFSKQDGLSVVVLGEDKRIEIMTLGGSVLWDGDDIFGGSATYLELSGAAKSPENPTSINRGGYYFIPPRLLMVDADGDGMQELLITKTEQSTVSSLVWGLGGLSDGSVYSLSLRQMTFEENWQTPDVGGYPSDYQIKDYNNDGVPDLIMVVITKSANSILSSGRSVIVAYSLDTVSRNKRKRGK